MSKLYAFPFGSDDTTGDSMWVPDLIVEATEIDSFEDLREKLLDEGFDKEDLEDLKGFWIFNGKTKRTIDKLGNNMDIDSDSAVYRGIREIKDTIKEQAVKTITA